ncbi:MAG: S8 family serine peptidase, partial [Pseudomonadota bacterium]|nr:S8 family serine peptidase [Pseudomonadota bacterium]
MAVSARNRIAAFLWVAAVLFAALPASAQTNDPNLTQEDLDCLRKQAQGGADCVPGEAADPDEFFVQGKPPIPTPRPGIDATSDTAGDAAEATSPPTVGDRADAADTNPNAVLLPGLIADLFPNPAPGSGSGEPAEAVDATPTSPPTDPAPEFTQAEPPAPPPIPPGSLAAAPPVAAPVAIQGEFVPDEVLVTIDGDAAVAADIAAAFGLEVRSQRTSTLLGATFVRYGIPDGRPVGVVLAQLAGDQRTTRRAPNHVYDLQQAAGAVNYAFQRIALAPDSASGENVRIAVIDTAVDETHPALKGAIAGQFDAMPGVEVTARDHGTSVAGLIAGTGDFRGIAPGSKIYHARAFEGGRSTMDIILSALDWAAEQEARIINMSFVGPKNTFLEEACAAARERDIVLVAAAGNNGPGAPYGYPAAYDGVIAVTATDGKDQIMAQANRGPYVFVSAPGVDVLAPVGGGQDLVTGTSFAAAIVSGAIANLIHAAPERSADWIEAALSSTARDLG